jgi:hypothetical protein
MAVQWPEVAREVGPEMCPWPVEWTGDGGLTGFV